VIRRTLIAAMHSVPFAYLVAMLERLDRNRGGVLAVLTYHRVDEPDHRPHLSPALLSATPAVFAEHMRFLAKHAHVVSAQEVLDAVAAQVPLPPRAVMITFDDAYCDFADHAWPVLKRLGLPVTLFVATAYPDHPERGFWWDRLFQVLSDPTRAHLDTPSGRYALGTPMQRRKLFKQLRMYVKTLDHDEAMAWIDTTCGEGNSHQEPVVLGWDDLRWLAREGVTLGAHTQTHPLVNRVSLERAVAEAVGSLRDLEREIGDVLPLFAYPSGGVDGRVVQAFGEDGFALAFTTERGVNDMRTANPLLLRRINVGSQTPLAALRAQMMPVMARFTGQRAR